MELDELIREYRKKFNENFPAFCLLGRDEKELISIIKKCISDGVPYDTGEIDPRKALY